MMQQMAIQPRPQSSAATCPITHGKLDGTTGFRDTIQVDEGEEEEVDDDEETASKEADDDDDY